MRYATSAFLLPALLASTSVYAQETPQEEQPVSSAGRVYGPTLEEERDTSANDDSQRYRLNPQLDGCFEREGSAPVLYDDRNGTRLSTPGAKLRLRIRFGEGGEGTDRHEERCRQIVREAENQTGQSAPSPEN